MWFGFETGSFFSLPLSLSLPPSPQTSNYCLRVSCTFSGQSCLELAVVFAIGGHFVSTCGLVCGVYQLTLDDGMSAIPHCGFCFALQKVCKYSLPTVGGVEWECRLRLR